MQVMQIMRSVLKTMWVPASCSQYEGEPADVWSCGVALYTMLVGAYPFQASECYVDSAVVLFMTQRFAQMLVPAAPFQGAAEHAVGQCILCRHCMWIVAAHL